MIREPSVQEDDGATAAELACEEPRSVFLDPKVTCAHDLVVHPGHCSSLDRCSTPAALPRWLHPKRAAHHTPRSGDRRHPRRPGRNERRREGRKRKRQARDPTWRKRKRQARDPPGENDNASSSLAFFTSINSRAPPSRSAAARRDRSQDRPRIAAFQRKIIVGMFP